MDCDVEKVNICVRVGKGELDCGVESVEVIKELEEALEATNPKDENIINKSPEETERVGTIAKQSCISPDSIVNFVAHEQV